MSFKKFFDRIKFSILYVLGKTPEQIWDKTLKQTLEDVPDAEKQQYETILQNLHQYVKNATVFGDDIKDKESLLLSITKNVFSNILKIGSIIGIQPLNAPVGTVMSLHETPKDGQVNIQLLSNIVTAATRKLKTKIALELTEDVKRLHGDINVEQEIINAVMHEISHEILSEILHTISEKGHQEKMKYKDASEIVTKIRKECFDIAKRTNRDSGNFIVVSPMLFVLIKVLLEQDNSFEECIIPLSDLSGCQHVGTMDGTIQIFVNIFDNDDKILIGYKGSSAMDAGLIYSPYIMVSCSGVVADPVTYCPHLGFITRSGMYIDKIDSYYTRLTLEKDE